MSSTVHRGRAVRKFGKCERKLKVLSCQAAIRQQCGCNELRVCVYSWMCVCYRMVISFPFPLFSYSLLHSHTHEQAYNHSDTHFNEKRPR